MTEITTTTIGRAKCPLMVTAETWMLTRPAGQRIQQFWAQMGALSLTKPRQQWGLI